MDKPTNNLAGYISIRAKRQWADAARGA